MSRRPYETGSLEEWMRIPELVLLAAVAATATRAGSAEPPAKTQALKLDATTSAQVPEKWKRADSGREFRVAEFMIPKAAGDTAVTQLIVFHFGRGGGGTVEDNVKRWMGLMSAPAGTDPAKLSGRKLVERKGLKVTTVDLTGTYQERPFPMAQTFTPRPSYRMLAAIVETTGDGGDGPYYLRIVGPEKTVTAAKAGWDELVGSIRVE
jgi:hypothetical protein